ncbi:hypothetical protein K474DRAFT_748854 [Panus rudis PR-1116 ss-1]|nr:hypothetical protein K474DRAFT_748854 [Panus rudis PR-1116 ss-1]
MTLTDIAIISTTIGTQIQLSTNSVPVSSAASFTTAVPSASQAVVTGSLTPTATINEPQASVSGPEPAYSLTVPITSPTSPSSAYSATTWSIPPQYSDLVAFNISAFAYGQENLQIVSGIPATASATSFAAAVETSGITNTTIAPAWDDSTSKLQLLYPAHSINPGSEPQGGAGFYATPLDLRDANNVTLEYSVFFPVDFDWVLAGKLPGIFGGHRGCSGGDAAVTCFSTRLMWRKGGAGELYLYAPKDKQSSSLCSTPPESVCDAAYGLSIGRGSFNFTPGAWTRVRQTVVLNTPGLQDGGFLLEVDGKQVINRSDVFYRDIPRTPSSTSQTPPNQTADPDFQTSPTKSIDVQPTPISTVTPSQPTPSSESGLGDLLSGLLGGLGKIGGMLFRIANLPVRGYFLSRDDIENIHLSPPRAARSYVDEIFISSSTPISPSVIQTVIPEASPIAGHDDEPVQGHDDDISYDQSTTSEGAHMPAPVGFTGLFFSTFFGGHELEYATPVDQCTWFKDFSMAINHAAPLELNTGDSAPQGD